MLCFFESDQFSKRGPGLALLCFIAAALPVAQAAETPVTSTLVAGGGTLSPDAVSGVPATDVLLGLNRGLYVDSTETLYVPNGLSDVGRVNIVDNSGNIFRFAGTGVDGAFPADGSAAINANIPEPIDVIDDDAGNRYVSVWAPTSTDGRIYRIDSAGNIFRLAGGGSLPVGTDNVSALDVRLFQPYAMQYRDGYLYFAELNFGRIARIDLSSGFLTTYGGGLSNRNASPIPDPGNPPDAIGFLIGDAQEIVFDSFGSLYFRTRNNGTPDAIRKITPDGKLHDVVTENGPLVPDVGVAAADLDYAYSADGLAIDSLDNLYFQMSAGRIVILNLNTGMVSHVLRVDNFNGLRDIEVAPDGDIYLADNRQVRRIAAVIPVVTNTAPIADCVVSQLTEIDDAAEVSFSGTGSSDAEDTNAQLMFDWTIDDGNSVENVSGETFTRLLGYGDYDITLVVTDTQGATDTCTTEVAIDPAALAVLDCEKIAVRFCLGDADSDDDDDSSGDDDSSDDDSSGCTTDKIRISGEIGLPVGVDYAELDAQALALVAAACDSVCDLEFSGANVIAFDVNGGHDEHWEYEAGGPGLTRFDIDWDGASFKYKESGFPVELRSELITSSATVLQMKYKMSDIGGAFTVDIDGTQLIVDASGVVTAGAGLDPAAIVVKKAGKKIEVTLPFPLIQSSSVNISGATAGLINVIDYYTSSLGRFRLEAETGTTVELGADTLPRNAEIIIGVGGPLYTNTCNAGPDDLEVSSRKWKAKK